MPTDITGSAQTSKDELLPNSHQVTTLSYQTYSPDGSPIRQLAKDPGTGNVSTQNGYTTEKYSETNCKTNCGVDDNYMTCL